MIQLSSQAKANLEKFFGTSKLAQEDLEFFTNYANFAFDEVFAHSQLEEKERLLLILAALVAIPAKEEFETMLKAALNVKVSPIAIKEVIYQATPYVGMGKVADILSITNKVFKQRGIKLPLAKQGRTTKENRYEKGLQAQVEIFGEGMRSARDKAANEKKHIIEFLSSNCFGDYYTRGGLELKFRELITFVYLISMGGAEPQVKAHIQGNLNMGNDRAKLIAVVTALIPYIGYPRSLNALNAIDEIA
nr:carboxymuconolactone decarboxylase family protein [Campylobacter avium]